MWRWADVREDVDMSRCEDEQMWEKMWTWADVKMSRCEDEQMWEKMWTWADVKMSRCERRCERRCEDEQMWENMWRWADVKMRRCCEDVKMSRCEDEQMWEKMWRWADVKMSRCERRCEEEQMWRWEDVKRRRCFTDPHYWKNPALRRSRELLHQRAFPFQKSLLRLLLLCCQASSKQVLPNSKHQTLLLKTTSPAGISLSKVLTKTAASVLPS